MADETTDMTMAAETTTEAAAEPVAPVTDAAVAPVDPADEGTILGGDAAEPDAGEAGKEADAAPVVPEKYELTPPQGMAFDTEAFAEAEPVFRELGLSNESAQKLMPVAGEFAKRVGAAAITNHELAQAAQFNAIAAQWAKDAEADPEIGGAKWGETRALADKALNTLGFAKDSPFRAFLSETKLGNHPEMIRAMRRIGERVSEDAFATGTDPKTQPKDIADRWYGKEGVK